MYWVVYCIAMYGCMTVLDVLLYFSALGAGHGKCAVLDSIQQYITNPIQPALQHTEHTSGYGPALDTPPRHAKRRQRSR